MNTWKRRMVLGLRVIKSPMINLFILTQKVSKALAIGNGALEIVLFKSPPNSRRCVFKSEIIQIMLLANRSLSKFGA